jgi:photosystem II stability/assembly factor-like uncharacterized protein
MTMQGTILVGTVGQGVMLSGDDGESWSRVGVSQGMHSDCVVRALASDPGRPELVYAGTDQGLYRTEDGGRRWSLLENPMRGSTVWSIAIDPADPAIIFAGTGTPSEPGIYRSTDSGATWELRPMEIAEMCPAVGIPRPTGIAIDPTNHRSVWVGFEVDGVRHSADGGETWVNLSDEIPNLDVHNMLVAGGASSVVFTVVNDDVWRSPDDGETWQPAHARENFPWHYARGITAKPNDPRTVFVTVGDATPGTIGAIMRSRDAGLSWEQLELADKPNSAMWTAHIPSTAPETVFAASRYGYLYRSDDNGDSWRKLWRELSEVSSLLWVPK